MTARGLLELSELLQLALCTFVLSAIFARKAHRIFPGLTLLLGTEAAPAAAFLALFYFNRQLGLNQVQFYPVYFWTAWVSTALTLVLRIVLVYYIFAEAMRPMAGLHQAGKLIFRWVGVVSGLVAFALVAGPGAFSSIAAWSAVLSRLQQGVSVLTLCLLVFVCVAIRPLGLTFRSHLFGVSLGLGLASTVELIQAAWQVTKGAQVMYSPVYVFSSFGFCASLIIWGTYFAMPEPERKMILLPTTSPFFFWNRISEILGDAPGHVAVAGFSPSMLAPAEIEMLTSATAHELPTAAPVLDAEVSLQEKRRVPDLASLPHPFLA